MQAALGILSRQADHVVGEKWIICIQVEAEL